MARDARMFAIGGGTVEMMRNLIADRSCRRAPISRANARVDS
jgi:alkylation response protein AidB-like acyl-CoA dehydrogenase